LKNDKPVVEPSNAEDWHNNIINRGNCKKKLSVILMSLQEKSCK